MLGWKLLSDLIFPMIVARALRSEILVFSWSFCSNSSRKNHIPHNFTSLLYQQRKVSVNAPLYDLFSLRVMGHMRESSYPHQDHCRHHQNLHQSTGQQI